MKVHRKMVFGIILLNIIFINSCKKNIVGNDKKPPGSGNFFDFRLTDYAPAWSPDGKTIAYVHGDTVDGKTGIYFIDTSGVNKRMIYSSVSAENPSWSPDGKWLVFSAQGQIFKMKINSDSIVQLTFEGKNFFPAWSPDGRWIAYDSNKDTKDGGYKIWKMKPDGENKSIIAGGRMSDWSPNSKLIIYIGFNSEIFKVNVNDPFDRIQLTHLNKKNIYATDNRFPKYSPDGTKIAYTSQPYGGKPQIWVMNSDGTNQKQLTETQGYGCDWSPDGKWIVYTDSRAINGRLWIMRKDGGRKHQLTFE